jgi:hypothetical protein
VHTWFALQVTPTHFGSTHMPVVESHESPPVHGFSRLQKPTHCPFEHTSPGVGQVAPLSTVPSQLSSRPLHVSGCGCTSGLHESDDPCEQTVIPSAHAPSFAVVHGTPAPLHSTPSTAVTRSVKSALVVSKVSSHAK